MSARAANRRAGGPWWWAGPVALVVLGGGTFALVIASDVTADAPVPDHVDVRPAASPSPTSATPTGSPSVRPTDRPTVRPTQLETSAPAEVVVQPTRPVVSESSDDNHAGDDGTHHRSERETER